MAEEKKQEDREEVKVDETVETETSEEKEKERKERQKGCTDRRTDRQGQTPDGRVRELPQTF